MENRENQANSTVNVRELCLQFVAEWESGHRPDLEAFVARVPEDSRPHLLAELINVDLMRRRELGEAPTPSDYIERFPMDRPTISAAFDAFTDTMGDAQQRDDAGLGSTEVDVAIGQKLGKYEIRSVLGKGGMGVVFGAYDTVIRREVAIKLLSSRHSNDEKALSRLLQEARTAGAIQHPNIVAIHDVLEENGSYYVVMEKVTGENLGEVLNQSPNGHLHWRSATRIIMDCCDAVEAAHSRGMMHRDIKPQNIMLTRDSRAKLLDFGLAKTDHSADTALTGEGTVLGTPDFMSPEQCRAGEVNQLTDVYSLGATYFALLTGRPPYASEGNHLKVMYAHCHEPVPSASEHVAEIPAACDTVIRKAMAKRPEDRFQTATELREHLAAVVDSDGSATVIMAASEDGTPQTAPQTRKWLAALTGACLLLAGIFWIWDSVTSETADSASNQTTPPAGTGSNDTDSRREHVFRGITADSIHLGTTTAFNGPNEELGRNMVVGMRACFEAVNAAGGIHGRKIQLTVLDDRYDPDRALANMQDLFEQRQVFAVIGNVGTPTARVTSKYASQNGYLFFAPFTGASLLREDPPDRYVFNYRASYEDETAAMVHYFVEELQIPADKIAVFAQNDSYGDDGFSGVGKAVRAYKIRPESLLRVGYDRNQLNVDAAVQRVIDSERDIRAIVMVPTYKVAAQFVRRVRAVKPEMRFGTVSFVGSKALAEEFLEMGGAAGEGVLITQVVPHFMSNATGVLRYRRLLSQYFPEYQPGFVSLEGYIAAECLVAGLKQAGPEPTTESLIDALHEIRNLDLGIGPIIEFSPSQHQASHKVWGTQLTADGQFGNVELD